MRFQTERLPYDLKLIQSDLIVDLFENAIGEILGLKSLSSSVTDEICDRHDSAINTNSLSVFKCPSCERFHIQDEKDNQVFHSYIKEVGE
ncbi:MAG: hypothetical protein ACRCV6_00110 [Formosimonas sp.]